MTITKYMNRVSILDRGDGVTRLWWANGYWSTQADDAILMTQKDADNLTRGIEFAWSHPVLVDAAAPIRIYA
jgi:hypothetical protein